MTSFCLVMFYQNQNSLASRLITVYSNRLGDIIILTLIASNKEMILSNNIKISATKFLILAARITKRAQIPFSA